MAPHESGGNLSAKCSSPHFSRYLIECGGGLTSGVPERSRAIWARLFARCSGLAGVVERDHENLVLLWAEGSESRAVERGPCGSKDLGVGRRRCHRALD